MISRSGLILRIAAVDLRMTRSCSSRVIFPISIAGSLTRLKERSQDGIPR
jgi:hypothetical protein